MSTTREQLLAAIRADPEEDTPRLMYADLLDELGGEENAERANYIRDSISRPEWSYTSNYPLRVWREKGIKGTVRRGFMEGVVCDADSWFKHAAEILAREPVRDVMLTTPPTIHFGPVQRQEECVWPTPESCHLEIRCKWTATVEVHAPGVGYHFDPRNTELFGFVEVFSEAVIKGQRTRDYAEEMIAGFIAKHRTPLGYLNLKWKDIRFEIVTRESGVANTYEADILEDQGFV